MTFKKLPWIYTLKENPGTSFWLEIYSKHMEKLSQIFCLKKAVYRFTNKQIKQTFWSLSISLLFWLAGWLDHLNGWLARPLAQLKLAGHHLNGWLAGPAAQQNVAGKIKCGWYPDTTDTIIIQPC